MKYSTVEPSAAATSDLRYSTVKFQGPTVVVLVGSFFLVEAL